MGYKKIGLWLSAIAIFSSLLVMYKDSEQISDATLLHRYASPTGEHAVEVWVYYERWSMPGDSGSGPGYVLLKNRHGAILQRKETELVISISEPKWEPDSVYIKVFAEWKLTTGG
jgi:hypothetical protein